MEELPAWLRELLERDLAKARGDAERLQPSAREGLIFAPLRDAENRIADCEAKLAILDEHGPDYLSKYGSPGPPLCQRCITAREGYEELWEADPWPCRTVRLLGAGYRYWRGYLPEWAPEAVIPSR